MRRRSAGARSGIVPTSPVFQLAKAKPRFDVYGGTQRTGDANAPRPCCSLTLSTASNCARTARHATGRRARLGGAAGARARFGGRANNCRLRTPAREPSRICRMRPFMPRSRGGFPRPDRAGLAALGDPHPLQPTLRTDRRARGGPSYPLSTFCRSSWGMIRMPGDVAKLDAERPPVLNLPS